MRLQSNAPAAPDRRLWERFIALFRKPDEAIRRFAEEYGPLRARPSEFEDISLWRRSAEIAAAIANAGMAVRIGKTGTPAEWKILWRWCFRKPSEPASTHYREWKPLIAFALSRWLNDFGQCSISIRWSGDYIHAQPFATELLGLVGLQIKDALGGVQKSGKCSNCGEEFAPDPHATRGTRRFCLQCRANAPAKYRMREWRARSKKNKKKDNPKQD